MRVFIGKYKQVWVFKNIQIQYTDKTSRNITEMLYIQSQPNSINKQEDTLLLNDMYTNTLYNYRNIKSQ